MMTGSVSSEASSELVFSAGGPVSGEPLALPNAPFILLKNVPPPELAALYGSLLLVERWACVSHLHVIP